MVVVVQLPRAASGCGSSAAVHIQNGMVSALNSTELIRHARSFSPAFTWGHKTSQVNDLLQPTAGRIYPKLASPWQDQPPSCLAVECFSLSSVQQSVFLP